MIKETLNDSKKRVEELEQELKILLLPKDPNDDKNVIVEIRAGAGGDEAALFAAEIYRMYVHYAEKQRWKVELINVDEIGIGGMKEVQFTISGQGDNFICFIRQREVCMSSAELMIHSLNAFKLLVHSGEYEKAFWELQKVMELIMSTYQTDDYSRMIDDFLVGNYTENRCLNALNVIFEIYTDLTWVLVQLGNLSVLVSDGLLGSSK